MLELKSYSMREMIDIFGITNPQNLERTLRGYKIEFTKTGNGKNAIYNITAINDELRLFCILDLGFNSRTDMRKLTNFLYFLLNNDEFVNMPEISKETMLRDANRYVSRQTIARYTEKLERANLIADGDFIYYFIKHNRRKETDENTYKKAWREYFKDKSNGASSREAIFNMLFNYGGYARKYAPPLQNAIERDTINYLNDLVLERIQKEYESE